MATFRETDTSPKEEFCYHNAGQSGRGTASYIDLVAFRDKDANTAWTSASDGVLEERRYVCQNWRADIVSIVTSTGTMQEWDKYSAYGVPYGIPGGDTDTDFDTDTTDVNQVQTWINGSTYDVRGDIDLDGDVDATDKTTIRNNFAGITLGRGVLSQTGVANRKGYAGYEGDGAVAAKWHVRNRVMDSVLGRWLTRDPAGYRDSMALYDYVRGQPTKHQDPQGLGIPSPMDWCAHVMLNCVLNHSRTGRALVEMMSENPGTAQIATGPGPEGNTNVYSAPGGGVSPDTDGWYVGGSTSNFAHELTHAKNAEEASSEGMSWDRFNSDFEKQLDETEAQLIGHAVNEEAGAICDNACLWYCLLGVGL